MKPVGTNGIGEPRYRVTEVLPGSIVRFGIDDDVVIVNYECLSIGYINGERRHDQKVVLYGCMCDSPDAWECQRLFSQELDLKDVLTVLLIPEYS